MHRKARLQNMCRAFYLYLSTVKYDQQVAGWRSRNAGVCKTSMRGCDSRSGLIRYLHFFPCVMAQIEYKVHPDSWVEDREYLDARIKEFTHLLTGEYVRDQKELNEALESQKYADEIMRRLRSQIPF